MFFNKKIYIPEGEKILIKGGVVIKGNKSAHDFINQLRGSYTSSQNPSCNLSYSDYLSAGYINIQPLVFFRLSNGVKK